MQALPPGKAMEDKYYLGFWEGKNLLAVMDLILKYPNNNTAFIGFFMMHTDKQGKGIGSEIIKEVCTYLKKEFTFIRLGYVKGNKQSESFWIKNFFQPTGVIAHTENYDIVIMQKTL